MRDQKTSYREKYDENLKDHTSEKEKRSKESTNFTAHPDYFFKAAILHLAQEEAPHQTLLAILLDLYHRYADEPYTEIPLTDFLLPKTIKSLVNGEPIRLKIEDLKAIPYEDVVNSIKMDLRDYVTLNGVEKDIKTYYPLCATDQNLYFNSKQSSHKKLDNPDKLPQSAEENAQKLKRYLRVYNTRKKYEKDSKHCEGTNSTLIDEEKRMTKRELVRKYNQKTSTKNGVGEPPPHPGKMIGEFINEHYPSIAEAGRQVGLGRENLSNIIHENIPLNLENAIKISKLFFEAGYSDPEKYSGVALHTIQVKRSAYFLENDISEASYKSGQTKKRQMKSNPASTPA